MIRDYLTIRVGCCLLFYCRIYSEDAERIDSWIDTETIYRIERTEHDRGLPYLGSWQDQPIETYQLTSS